jgi:hypothetical protein
MRMSYTLAAAATATGLNKTTILRAIKDGKIAASRDERGEWHVEPAELHLVFPPVAARDAGPDLEALGAQIEALLRQAGDRLRRQIDGVRRDPDAGRDQAHDPRLLLAGQDEPRR